MWFRDLRHGLLSLRRAPGLTAVSVLTIALGIGAGTALFSVVKAVLLNPLPYGEPGRLAWVASLNATQRESQTSFADFTDWRAQNRSFSSMAAFSAGPFVAGGGDVPTRTVGAIVTQDFFDVLGARPAMGRLFSADEHQHGKAFAVVVIGHALWQRAYGADPQIVGREITVLGLKTKVIGVMPPAFAFPERCELWASASALNEGEDRTAHNYRVIARLRPAVTLESAGRDVSTIARSLSKQYPGPYQTADASVVSLAAHLVAGVRTPLLILFGAVGLLLAIVCVNVANLLLVRMSARSRELAVRSAMGARRSRLFQYLLTESLLLAAAGGAAGLLVAYWSMDLLHIVLPATLPRVADIQIDGGVIAFAALIAAATGILFGTLPSWRASGLNVHDVLKAGARGQSAGRRSQRTQAALVISEVALSVVLLAGAGLLLTSFMRLRAVQPGFDPHGLLSVNISFPADKEARARLTGTYAELLAHTRSLPGVQFAGTIKDLPLDPLQRDGNFLIESRREAKGLDAGYLIISPGLMEALSIPLIRGRRFTESDGEGAPGVAMVSESMARQFWPGRDPIGDRIWYNSFDPRENWLTIVGIVADIRQAGLTAPPTPQAYVCYPQVQIKGQLNSANLLVRTARDPRSIVETLRRLVREVSPQSAAAFRTMDDVMAEATSRQRFQMQVLGTFAALALLLAAIGLYGVLSYTVSSNRAAIGIRMALGAQPGQVFRAVALRALWLTLAGAAAGISACLALRSVLATVVFGVGPSDPFVLAAASAAMTAVALAACWFPARRAMKVDPMSALREE